MLVSVTSIVTLFPAVTSVGSKVSWLKINSAGLVWAITAKVVK